MTRAEFEAAYAAMMNAQSVAERWGIEPYTPAEISEMRDGEGYRMGTNVLNACWTIWKEAQRHALESAARSCDANAIAYGAMGSTRMKEAARACAVTIRSHAEKGAT